MNKHTATVLNFIPPASNNKNLTLDDERGSLVTPHFLVLIDESDVSETGVFLQFLRSFRPKAVLDLRISPRLDFVAGSRARTFRTFDDLSVEYVDVLGRLDVYSRNDFLALKTHKTNILATLIDTDENNNRPVVCLFDDTEILARCRKLFKHDILSYFQSQPSTNVSWYRSGLLSF